MFKKACNLLIVFSFILLNSSVIPVVTATEPMTEYDWWNYYQPISIEQDIPYKSFYLNEDVYRNASSDLSDLRIKDKQGEFVPYYIQSGYWNEQQQELAYGTHVVDTAQDEQDTIIDYKVEAYQSNEDVRGNVLAFTLPDKDFLKHMKMEGSYDGNHWEYVGEDYIYQAGQRKKERVVLNQVFKYTYYRITILDNAEGISFDQLHVVYNNRQVGYQDFMKQKQLDFHITTEQKKTSITFDNPNHLKIRRIHLDIKDNFQRSYTLYDQNKRVIPVEGKRELYQMKFTDVDIANKMITAKGAPITSDQFVLVIDNEDNPPLKIENIEVAYQIDKVVFKDEGSAPYRLYFGNPTVDKPQYDLAQFKTYIENEPQEIVKLGEAVEITRAEQEKQDPPLVKKEYIFNGVVIIVSLALIILVTMKLNKKSSR